MAYTGKIRGMKEEGCQTLLETFVKLYIEEQFKGQEDIGTKVIETTGFKVDDRSDLWPLTKDVPNESNTIYMCFKP